MLYPDCIGLILTGVTGTAACLTTGTTIGAALLGPTFGLIALKLSGTKTGQLVLSGSASEERRSSDGFISLQSVFMSPVEFRSKENSGSELFSSLFGFDIWSGTDIEGRQSEV
ncbi:Hypothetical_protein [Hexamita inflata]|uniref:Hypothetical_protein n=1 Tax=Hexamita inflata TaxID=28002 RepID=A0AA86U6N4_9EUKA|nr:Hypothetical protein HINF_LOCUS19698 [Hexamita inflata]